MITRNTERLQTREVLESARETLHVRGVERELGESREARECARERAGSHFRDV